MKYFSMLFSLIFIVCFSFSDILAQSKIILVNLKNVEDTVHINQNKKYYISTHNGKFNEIFVYLVSNSDSTVILKNNWTNDTIYYSQISSLKRRYFEQSNGIEIFGWSFIGSGMGFFVSTISWITNIEKSAGDLILPCGAIFLTTGSILYIYDLKKEYDMVNSWKILQTN